MEKAMEILPSLNTKSLLWEKEVGWQLYRPRESLRSKEKKITTTDKLTTSITCSLCEVVLSLLLPLLQMRLPEPVTSGDPQPGSSGPQEGGQSCWDGSGTQGHQQLWFSFHSSDLNSHTHCETSAFILFFKATLIYFLVLLSVFSHSIVTGSLRPPWTAVSQASPTPELTHVHWVDLTAVI